MENTASDYYFSEKLIDCLLLETVPIYFGCPGIGEVLDPRGMICFSTLEELKLVLDSLTSSKYEAMRPFLLANKAKVIKEKWHSHAGLFERIVRHMPESESTPKQKEYPKGTAPAHSHVRLTQDFARRFGLNRGEHFSMRNTA